MSLRLKQNIRDEQDMTTQPQTRRSTKKMFKRQPSQHSHSNDSRRSINRSAKKDISDCHKLSYIRVPLEMLPSMTEIQESVPHSLNQQSSRLSHLGKKIQVGGSIACVATLQKKVENMEAELIAKNKQIEDVESQKRKMKKELEQIIHRNKLLSETHQSTLLKCQSLQEQLRKTIAEVKKSQQEKLSLNKKVQFLQKVQFTSDTKNIQTLRQIHLESEIQVFKTKLKQSKSQIESLLEQQIEELREQLFNSKKLIESLQINNDCLQKKLDSSNYLVCQEDNYNALKVKYRKFLSEYKDLKKLHESALKQNKTLRAQIKGQIKDNQSLQLSLFSTHN